MQSSQVPLDYKTFGRILLDTYDLDPLYVILAQASFPDRMLKRFLLAYWVFYSAGVACKIAESKNFYRTMFYGNDNKWPRGHERRHMRGKNFMLCVSELQRYGCPESIVDSMTDGDTFQDISTNTQLFRGFGPWIGWKVADMTERVLCHSVDFSDAELGVYRDPVKGAALLRFGDQKHPITLNELHEVVNQLQSDFGNYKAPPYLDRPVNIQEIETILCKYKSYINGHYPIGNDTYEIHEGLKGCGDMAQELEHHLDVYVKIVNEEKKHYV